MPSKSSLLPPPLLGTARHPPPADLDEWLDLREATDPAAGPEERLLAAYALLERVDRLSPTLAPRRGGAPALRRGGAPVSTTPVAPATAPLPSDTHKKPADAATLYRALDLTLDEDGYPQYLPAVLPILRRRELHFAPHQLAAALELAYARRTADTDLSDALYARTGPRGAWLAAQHLEWKTLRPDHDFATDFAREATPGGRADLLRRWRKTEADQPGPGTALAGLDALWKTLKPKAQEQLLPALETGLSAADIPWLRAALGPKRKGVRRELLRLLLLAGDPETTAELTAAAVASLDDKGAFVPVLRDDAVKETLQQYGGLASKETPAEFFLSLLPPTTVSDLLGRDPAEFWAGLSTKELAAAARAVRDFPDDATRAAFLRYAAVIAPDRAPKAATRAISARLPQAVFLTTFHWLLEHEVGIFYSRGTGRWIALARREPWDERISKAFLLHVSGLAGGNVQQALLARHQFDNTADWKRALPLLDPGVFGWAKTQLFALTERGDVYGKLAGETLRGLGFLRGIAGR